MLLIITSIVIIVVYYLFRRLLEVILDRGDFIEISTMTTRSLSYRTLQSLQRPPNESRQNMCNTSSGISTDPILKITLGNLIMKRRKLLMSITDVVNSYGLCINYKYGSYQPYYLYLFIISLTINTRLTS